MFKGNKGFGGEKRMFKTTCDSCGGVAEVPFRPDGSKPVYCRDCFRKDEGFGRREAGERKMYQVNCASCGTRTEVPFRPTGERPVYCKSCFGAQKGGERPQATAIRFSDGSADEFRAINAKLDAIMKMLAAGKEPAPEKPAEEKPDKKAKAAKKTAPKKKK